MSSPEARPDRTSAALQFARSILHLVAVVSITVWGFLGWPLPLPGIVVGGCALVLSVLLWGLFLSPRPVLHADRFARALFELLFAAAACASLLALGAHWALPVTYGVAAVAVGLAASTRDL